jgi:peptidyl-prolyl cis-trans isomerase C
MKQVKFLLTLTFIGGMALSGCQDRLVMSDNSPFGEGVMRLGDTEVADIDGTKIYLSDVERTAAAQGLIEQGSPLAPGQPVFQKVLDELIDQRLLALDALRQSLDQEDETRRRLSAARERILGNILVEHHLRDTVNETTIRRMYDEQASLSDRGDEVQARHILLKDEETAKNIAKKLASGADFAGLAREISEDENTRNLGGNLGYFTNDMLEAKFTNVAFTMKKGEISKPFKTKSGWHILQVQNRRKAPKPTFEEMRSEILNFMTYDEIQNILKSLRAQSDIKLLFGQAVVNQGETENTPEISENE